MNLKLILKHLDQCNLELYAALRDNEPARKELERLLAYVLPLWMSGTLNGRDQINLMLDFNEHINIGWWGLEKHPELRAKLLAAIGPGRVLQHDFHARKQRRMGALMSLLAEACPDIRQDEVQLWCSVNTEAALLDLCADHGVQIEDRPAIVNEYRNIVS